jgi:hypothetical protein
VLPSLLFHRRWCGRLYQILVKLECKVQSVQKFMLNLDIRFYYLLARSVTGCVIMAIWEISSPDHSWPMVWTVKIKTCYDSQMASSQKGQPTLLSATFAEWCMNCSFASSSYLQGRLWFRLFLYVMLQTQKSHFLSLMAWVSNPRPARLPYAAQDHICKLGYTIKITH